MKQIMSVVFTLALVLSASVLTQAQDNGVQDRQDRRMPPGEGVMGKVTSVSSDSLLVTPAQGGDPVTVKVGENTRIMKQREPIKLEEIKAGDTVFARGELKNQTMQAAIVGVVNPDMMRMGPGGAGFNGAGFNREDLGKKFIVGQVKAIHETTLTIARPDGQSQDIQVDENTSFKRGRESITLPDIKEGDVVRGPGELKNGVFVAKEINVGRGGQMRMFQGGTGNPQAEKPAQAPPQN